MAAASRAGSLDEEVTIFDSTGTGPQDVAAAVAVYQRAVAANAGQTVEPKRRQYEDSRTGGARVRSRVLGPSEDGNFDSEPGSPPEGWEADTDGQGLSRWGVAPDSSAPSAPHVLQQSGNGTFPWCVKKDVLLEDGYVEVKFKPIKGREDQAGGGLALEGRQQLLRRAQRSRRTTSPLLPANARNTIKYVDAPAAPNTWHALRVEFAGKRIRVNLNGKTYIDVEDIRISGSGAVGLWTKADSVTAFDDFSWGK